MLLPIVLIVLSVLSAAFMACGTHGDWVNFRFGLDLIMAARRLQWPLVTLSLLLCMALLVLVISGRRRAWWLLGLAPVLALFGHRFLAGPAHQFTVCDEPAFVAASERKSIRDDDYVVGLTFAEQDFAYPYAELFLAPVVVQSDREKRLMLMWSPFANTAVAYHVSRDVKARDIQIVSDPANSLLLYNTRVGQFIVSLTGLMPGGERPSGFLARIPVVKTTWSAWKSQHPQTLVMAPTLAIRRPVTHPLVPHPMPGFDHDTLLVDKRVMLLVTTPAVAVVPEDIGNAPLNVSTRGVQALVFRDRTIGLVRAFDRHVEPDLSPRFALNSNGKRKGVAFTDGDTDIGWSVNGVAVDGDPARRGHKLTPIEVQEDVYWGPAKFWYGELELQR